jgi:hypothetical protein
MTIEVRLRRAAQCEHDEAVAWYEERRSGLGVRFSLAVNEAIAAISEQPDRFPEVWPGTREAMVTNWP